MDTRNKSEQSDWRLTVKRNVSSPFYAVREIPPWITSQSVARISNKNLFLITCRLSLNLDTSLYDVSLHHARYKLWSQCGWYRYPISVVPDIKRIPARWQRRRRKKKLVMCLWLFCASRAGFLAFLLSRQRYGRICHLTVSLGCVHFRSSAWQTMNHVLGN